MNVKDFIIDNKVIAIARGIYGQDLENLAKALVDGGVRLMEVTFDQKDPDCIAKTSQSISLLKAVVPCVGAGTVLTQKQLVAAKDSGASFIVSPNADLNIISKTKEYGLVSMPGATTPNEIINAYNAGADIVKLFPSVSLGIQYIKDIIAPLNHIDFFVNGGITEENFESILKLGIKGAGISGRLTDKALIKEKNWAELSKRAAVFTDIAKRFNWCRK